MKQQSLVFLMLGLVALSYQVEARAASKKLDILVVTDKFPFSSRPFINNQIKGLLDKGHSLWIWCTEARDFSDTEMPQCLQNYNWTDKIFYKELPPKSTFNIILCQFGDKGRDVLKQKKAGLLAGKVITFFRGEDVTARINQNPNRYDELLQKGDLFLPVCNYFKKCLEGLGGDPKKIIVIHSAIDCEKFAYKEHRFDASDSIELISVNRLTAKKGTLFSIMAVALLKSKYPKLRYTIVGDGPLMSFLAKFIDLLHASKYIHLVGEYPHHEVAGMLEKAHIFVLPSITAEDLNQEGIPNVLMEAMAVGLPVVSTFHAGIPELVKDGKSGFLVPERDVEGLMEKIAYLIEHPQESVNMGKVGRRYVEKEHNTIIVNDRLEKLLLALDLKEL